LVTELSFGENKSIIIPNAYIYMSGFVSFVAPEKEAPTFI
jgi:hypothetical protein